MTSSAALAVLTRRVLGGAGLVLGVPLAVMIPSSATAAAAPTPAQTGVGERVVSFRAALDLTDTGGTDPAKRYVLHVRETIDYDFAGNARHGIFRFLPTRFRCEAVGVSPLCPAGYDRLTPLSHISVSSPTGAPADVDLSNKADNRVIRIGDPKRTISGRQTYEISYDVGGVLNPTSEGGTELAWNITGNGWEVPIDAVDATITVPGASGGFSCKRGAAGSTTPCATAEALGPDLHVADTGLAAGEGVTTYVRQPTGATDIASILDQRLTFDLAFSRSPAAFATAGVMSLLGGGLVLRSLRRGRDRRFAGSDVELAMGRAGQAEAPMGAFDKLPQVMEFAPPAAIRPGQIGALVDERVDTRDVTATIIDLAIRGHLRITEIADEAGTKVVDHQLDHLMAAPETTPLLPYERTLLDKLFATGSTVRLSALKQTWAASFGLVRTQMYTDLVDQGWYQRRPDQQRVRAIVKAVLGLVLALIVALVFVGLKLGLAAIPLLVAAVAGVVVARKAPARTAAGTAIAARSLGFRRLMETPTQQEMAKFAERHDVYIQYLAYAIAFGCATQWARTFAGLAASGATTGLGAATFGYWYVPVGGGGGSFSFDAISARVDAFSHSAAANLTASAPSTSSGGGGGGVSGGGFGGGGGGSW